MDQSNLGFSAKNEYEFLDLSDVDDIERTRLSSALLHKQQQKQQQKHQQQLQPFDKHDRASLIKHDDAADVQSRISQSTTSTDSECQIVLNDNCNIQSNLCSINSTHNATSVTNSNPAETKQIFRLSYKKLSKQNQSKKEQMPKMSPHVNSQEDLTSPQQQQQQQQQAQNTPNQQVQQQQTQLPVQSGNNQSTPSQSAQQPQNTQPTPHSQNQTQPIQQTLPPQSNHPTNNSASNIPSHNVQSHIYPQSQPQFMQNYLPHVGPAGNLYHFTPYIPSVHFSHFTANVNVHGYTQAMQPPFLPANYIPDNHQSGVEQSTHPIQTQPHYQRPRRGGRRGGNNGGYTRREFTSRQINSVQEINSAQTPTHGIDSPAMMQQSSNFAPYYVEPYLGLYPNQFAIGHHSTTAAQHATGTPLYGYSYPYHPVIYPAAVMPLDYVVDEKSDDGMGQEQLLEYSQGQVDSQVHQPVEEYLSNQPQALPPQNDFSTQQTNEEFVMRQPNEFIPQKHQQHHHQHHHQQQQQHQQQLQPNEFIVDHHSPHLNEFVAPPQEQNMHHQQHQHTMIEPETINEIPNQNDIKQQPEHSIQSHIINRDSNRNNEQMFENAQAPSFANILNDSHTMIETSSSPSPIVVPNDIKNVLNNSVPKNQQTIMLQPLVDTNENNIPNTIGDGQLPPPLSSTATTTTPASSSQQMQTQSKPMGPVNGPINGIVQAMNEKLVVRTNSKAQQTPTTAWNIKKSTQSVAVSVVPSNNYSHNEMNATKQHVLGSNNSSSCNNNNNIPIVPKLDEQHQQQSSKVNVTAATEKSIQSNQDITTTQQSSETQTIPVTDMQTDEPSIFANNNNNVSSRGETAKPPASTQISWASLFSSSSSSDSQKKPTAKVPPYNSSQEPKSNNPPLRTTSSATATTNTNAPEKSMSYSSAASSSANGTKRPAPTKVRVAPLAKQPQNSSEPTNDESSYRLGDFMLKYKVDNNSISLRPRGLTNRSNYCYINAILQALLACPPFYNLMKSIPLDAPVFRFKTNTPTIDAVVELVREFSNLPNGSRLHRRDKGGNKKEDVTFELVCDQSIEPTAIHKLWNSTRNDNEGRQEDAEEFLGYVLNKLNDEMLELKKLVEKPAEPVPNGMENGDGADDEGNEWQLIGTRNKGTVTRSTDFGRTPVSDIFRGELRSRLQREGDHSTDVMQPFFTLQLNIEKANSVKEALENFVNKDQLEGVTCTKTNLEVNAWQQMTLEKLPIVLILHLKWFDYKGDVCTKILKTVDFPIELKLDPKILSSKKYNAKQRQYRLFAIVYHDGKEASKGHYITDVYHTGYLNWIRYDDSTVKRVSEKSVLHPHGTRVPYLLYYQRIDTIPAPANANTNANSNAHAHK
ncbi:ubiquitin carboxyl-terminal hydrolase 10-A isoform X4 [Contarinia nasturtii]|uniref:ubiquitin carboxyl-terminal hydrolase 10-A isoform X4 n=1 Tax=Contarinia nasturtii TaxID=265458 RepID=UPI0012D3F841|nr:ubiquitin carboxyl-terminal hydrolase 10-A isoform X4 [Contarinia nasturtii]